MKEKFKPEAHWIWDDDNAVYKDDNDCDKSGVPAAYTEDGDRLRGYGSPYYRDKYQNKDGRPSGRDTSKLERAQDDVDSFVGIGIKRLRLMALNKWEELGLADAKVIPVTQQIKISMYLIDKSMAAEKEKVLYEARQAKEETKEDIKDQSEKDVDGDDYKIESNVVVFDPE